MVTYDLWPSKFRGNERDFDQESNWNPDPEPENYSPKWAGYGDWNRGGAKLYRTLLRKGMRDQISPASSYRTQAYGTIGAQQAEADRMAKSATNQAFGMGQSTPVTAGLQAQNALLAPYAQEGIRAREVGRDSAYRAGQALAGTKQMQANWYNSMVSPIFQQYGLDTQRQASEDATAISLGAMGGGGDGGAMGGGLGSLLGSAIGSAFGGGIF